MDRRALRKAAATVVALPAAGFLLAAGLGACSNGYHNSHDYNAPSPTRTWQPPNGWTRIETPGNFPNGVFACHGTDGIYQSSDSASSMIVVGHDTNCGAK